MLKAKPGLSCRVQATDKDWAQLQGKFLINGSPSKLAIFLEGPPPGTDILINYFGVKHAAKVPPSPPPVIEVSSKIEMMNTNIRAIS